jgi:hypothetical protein
MFLSTLLESTQRVNLIRRAGALRDLVDRIRPRMLAVYLLGMTALVFFVTPVDLIGGDSPGIAYLPASILRWGSLRLDAFVGHDPLFNLAKHPHYLIASNGHYYSKFSPLPSLLALPIYAPYIWLSAAPEGRMYLILSRIVAILLAATVTALLFLALRRLVAQWQALLLAMVYAFCTFTWAAATITLQAQSSAELFLVLAILILLRIEETGQIGRSVSVGWCALAGLLIGLAVAARAHTVLVALVLSIYVCQRMWGNVRALVSYGIGALVVVLLLGAYNLLVFGSPLNSGYGSEAFDWTTPIWVGLPGILVSPAHGLLMYSPAMILAAVGGWVVWREPVAEAAPEVRAYWLLGRYLALACLAYLLLMSHWWAWHGGNAYNQRMLEEIHPLLVLLLGFALKRYRVSPRFVVLLIIAASWSIVMNLARLTFYEPRWGEVFRDELVWSLRDAELVMYIRWHGFASFLAGICLTALRVLVALALSSALFLRLALLDRGRI